MEDARFEDAGLSRRLAADLESVFRSRTSRQRETGNAPQPAGACPVLRLERHVN